MEYYYSGDKPQLRTMTRRLGQPVYTLNLFPEETEDDGYKYVAVTLPLGVWERNAIINALINLYYPTDRMDAIRNNYDLVRDGVAEDKMEEYTKEYLDMQAWRKKAKELADEIMKEIERQHG